VVSGLDTTFLIEAEVIEHPKHESARRLLDEMLENQESLAIAPQVLSEFVHIVTDNRRFSNPLEVAEAVARASAWWRAKEIVQACPTDHFYRHNQRERLLGIWLLFSALSLTLLQQFRSL